MKRRHVRLSAGDEVPARSPGAFAFYTLWEGWAARSRTTDEGARQILDFVLPGDTEGLSAVLLDIASYRVHALTAVTLCELDASHLNALFRNHPGLALSMLKARIQEQERTDTRLMLLGRMGATERVAYLLLDLRERMQQRGVGDGGSLPFPLQRAQIADAVGLSRAHVMRALRELRERGLVRIDRRTIRIPNAARLARLCGFRPSRAADESCPII